MNKHIKKKYTKEAFKHYKGVMIWLNHKYSPGHKPKASDRAMLCYDETGNELYFKTISEAMKYIDRNWPKFVEKEKLNSCPTF